jgi:uncharacterized protein
MSFKLFNNDEFNREDVVIIDSHVHLGGSTIFGTQVTEKRLIETMDSNGVDACIAQPLPGAIPDSRTVHDAIHALSRKHPGRIYGVASISPHLPKPEVEGEIRRCIEELGFVGIKCHTVGHTVNPLSPNGDLLFRLADRFHVPIIVHTGNGVDLASPCLVIPKAREYPGVKIVLAHSGMVIFSADAWVVAKECPNVYLETSWTSAEDIEWYITSLGSRKVMMGSDIYSEPCYNQAVELQKYRIIRVSEEDRGNCLAGTAVGVFSLKR